MRLWRLSPLDGPIFGGDPSTLSGFGSQFYNFGTLLFDSSSNWLVATDTSIASTVINGFAAGDTINLTGFVAVSETFANNAPVLTNASNAHATLHIQGSFISGSFSLASDGATHTDIFLANGHGLGGYRPTSPPANGRLP